MILVDNRKLHYFTILFCLGIILNSGIAFSGCLNYPSSIEVTSGGNNLGEFDYTYISTGNRIYIKENLASDTLKVSLVFQGNDADCFSSNDDVRMRLFPAGLTISATSITNSGNDSIANFIFNTDVIAPESFTSNYIVYHKNNPAGSEDVIYFGTDNSSPIFSQLAITPSSPVLEVDTSVQITFTVIDSQSGIKTVSVTGSDIGTINFDGNSTYSNFFSETLTNSKTYTIKAVDMLGNEKVEEIEFLVDTIAPQISNLDVLEYSRDSDGSRYVSFSADVDDASFELINDVPTVYGDFSVIASGKTRIDATTCSKVPLFEDKYVCEWHNVPIDNLKATTNAQISFTTRDSSSNEGQTTLSHEVFFDNEGPVINDFYLQNYQGLKNTFKAADEEAFVYLEFDDESMQEQVRLIADFDGIEFYISPSCDIVASKGNCTWYLDSSLSKYSGIESGSVVFEVTLIDVYGNPTTKSINLTYDNVAPTIYDIELIETTDIEDGVVNSNERINFRLYMTDNNMMNQNIVYANFYSIVLDEEYEKVDGTCSQYNETAMQCDFNGIVVDNGYMYRNVTFYVVDLAGNAQVENYLVEVLKVGDEITTTYQITDIPITNVLNRHLIMQSGANGWFEGNIETINVNASADELDPSSFLIVNYQLQGCNDSGMNPILIGDRNLYPNEVVQDQGTGKGAQRNFVLKTEVKTHNNMPDLNQKTMECTLSILKRDAQTLYPAELVDFNIIYDFYDLPQDTLLKANAQNILDDIEDIEWLGDWFDDIYDIYSIMNDLCSITSGASSTISTVNNVWVFISWALHATGYGKAPAKVGDSVLFKADGMISTLLNGEDGKGPIKLFCDFVTCRNGGLLGTFWSESSIGSGVSKWTGQDWLNSMSASWLCGVDGVSSAGSNYKDDSSKNEGVGNQGSQASILDPNAGDGKYSNVG